MAGLFCNLDEVRLFDTPGSTGLATGNTMEEAKVAALLEIMERDAEAVTPFSKTNCFSLGAGDARVAALLADYAARGIKEVVPIVRTGFSGFLACLFPYQAAFKSPSRYQVSGVLPSRLLWGRAWL